MTRVILSSNPTERKFNGNKQNWYTAHRFLVKVNARFWGTEDSRSHYCNQTAVANMIVSTTETLRSSRQSTSNQRKTFIGTERDICGCRIRLIAAFATLCTRCGSICYLSLQFRQVCWSFSRHENYFRRFLDSAVVVASSYLSSCCWKISYACIARIRCSSRTH
jgi:hypothetical protein